MVKLYIIHNIYIYIKIHVFYFNTFSKELFSAAINPVFSKMIL